MKDLPKGKDKVLSHIFSLIWRADPDQYLVARNARRRILISFGGREDGRELADGLIEIVDYYTLLGYWRGYRDAKRHYQTTLKRKKTPADRKGAQRVVMSLLRRNEDATTMRVLKALDDAGVSGGFGDEDYFGPRIGTSDAKKGERWIDGHGEQAVVQWIHRIRKRVKTERLANAWLSRSSKINLV
jgi:hypothetical protein